MDSYWVDLAESVSLDTMDTVTNTIVEIPQLPLPADVAQRLAQEIDPLTQSTPFGMDLYESVRTVLRDNLRG